MSWRTCVIVYKQMQSNPVFSFSSQSFKAVDFSQLVCSNVLFTQTQRNFSIQISIKENYNATWVRKASFWKEAVLFIFRFRGEVENCLSMMTSSNGNIFRVTGLLCGEFTGYWWIPRTKSSDAELWCFLWSAPEQTVGQTIVRLVIWDAMKLIMTSL